MGQLLFWLEAAIASVLFVALGAALVSRVQRRWRRWLLRLTWSLLALLPWGFAIAAFAWVEHQSGGAFTPLISSSVAAGLFIIAALVVIRCGRRPSVSATGSAAAAWRLGRLTLAWGAAVVLACMTFWNLDLAVRQAMATTRVEAGAIALSVSPPRIPDSQNAALLYRRAREALDAQGTVTVPVRPSQGPSGMGSMTFGDMMQMGPDAPTTREVDWDDAVREWLHPEGPEGREFTPDDEQMLAFLREQAPVIGLLRQAAKRPGCDFGTEYNPPLILVILPPLNKMRDLGRLLCLSSRVAAHEGRMDEAMEDLTASVALGAHCTAEPPLIAVLISASAEGEAFAAFQSVLDMGPMTDEMLEAARAIPSVDFNAALHRGMRMETAYGMSIFGSAELSVVWRELRAPAVLGEFQGLYRVFLWEKDREVYLRYMRIYDEVSSRPYYEYANTPKWLEGRSKKMGGLLTTAWAPGLRRAPLLVVVADAKHRLVELAVAMWRYRLAHGAFPDALDQLVPEYVLTVPVDPCTGRGMMMLRTEGQLMVYSVGPDGKDDGGEPLDRSKMQGDIALVLSR